MKLRRYWIKAIDQQWVESIDSYYDPKFKWRKDELMISIIGRDCEMLYYASEAYIVKVEEL